MLKQTIDNAVVSEAVVDHDYTLLAMRGCGEGSKDLWNGLVAATKKMESLIAEPIRAFLHEDLKHFKVPTNTPADVHLLHTRLSNHVVGNPPLPRARSETV